MWKNIQMGEDLKVQQSERSLHKQIYVFVSTWYPANSLDIYFEAYNQTGTYNHITHCIAAQSVLLSFFPTFFTFLHKHLLSLLQPCKQIHLTHIMQCLIPGYTLLSVLEPSALHSSVSLVCQNKVLLFTYSHKDWYVYAFFFLWKYTLREQ